MWINELLVEAKDGINSYTKNKKFHEETDAMFNSIDLSGIITREKLLAVQDLFFSRIRKLQAPQRDAELLVAQECLVKGLNYNGDFGEFVSLSLQCVYHFLDYIKLDLTLV
jgi:hypothetical protein